MRDAFTLLAILSVMAVSSVQQPLWAGEKGFLGHTPPNFWERPRIFHEPFSEQSEKTISLRIEPFDQTTALPLTRSPNQAYWYALDDSLAERREITVFSERDQVMVISIPRVQTGYGPKLRWINQKLLYGEMWHGRRHGEVFVLDVEKARFLIHERVVWGQIHFQQWREGCRQFPDTPQCRKRQGLP